MKNKYITFVWDFEKERVNINKHGVDFNTALKAFADPNRVLCSDSKHSINEERFFCMGRVGNKVLTVRFTYSAGNIRIIGAGYWRKGEKYYEKEKDRPGYTLW